MKKNDAVKQSYLPPENYLAFRRNISQTGEQDYGATDLTGKGVVIYTKKA